MLAIRITTSNMFMSDCCSLEFRIHYLYSFLFNHFPHLCFIDGRKNCIILFLPFSSLVFHSLRYLCRSSEVCEVSFSLCFVLWSRVFTSYRWCSLLVQSLLRLLFLCFSLFSIPGQVFNRCDVRVP